MLGAIIGDIVGSRYEWNNIKTKTFPLFGKDCPRGMAADSIHGCLAIIANRITVLGTVPLCVFLPVAGLWIAALPQEQDFFLLMPEKWQSCQLR